MIGYPIIAGIRQSLFSTSQEVDPSGFVVEGEQFVGLDNYTAIFSGEAGERFWNAFYNTTFFTVVCVAIEVVIGVAMALIMNKALRGKGLIRASILVPWAIPTVVSALLWRWIFDANGIANAIINQQILWSTDGWQAKAAVIIADTWKTAPFIGLLVLAGLQVIPNEVYEAARSMVRRHSSSSGHHPAAWCALPSWSQCCSASSTTCGCSTSPTSSSAQENQVSRRFRSSRFSRTTPPGSDRRRRTPSCSSFTSSWWHMPS